MIFPADEDVKDPRPTALYAATAALSAANLWTSINGCAAARLYTTLEEEYAAASEEAALVDLGALRRYTLRGADAATLLARMTTTPVHELGEGESARGLMLDGDGAVADLAELTRLSGDLYLLTTARPADRRLSLAARGLDVAVSNIAGMVAALGVVGPGARDAASASGVDVLSADATAQGRVRGVELAIRPINFGSVPGVEIIYPAEDALVIFERLRRKRPLPAAGLDALEILRIEGGAPRIGVDFESADLGGDKRLPDEVGLPHLAPPNRAWFNGRRAMKRAKPTGRWLVVLSVDADAVAKGAAIYAKGEKAGEVTSSVFSPRLRRALCFADLDAAGFGKPLEVAMPTGARAPAQLHDTAESRLAAAFRDSLRLAESRR